jgi:monothiol glutaredoxin
MGLRDKIKRRLPIIGGQRTPPPTAAAPRPRPPAADFKPEWEEPTSPRGDKPVAEFLQEFTAGNKIVLFMKGSPDAPKCGFSANAAGILMSYGKPLTHFDVFLDPGVRAGIKEFSQWPTLPQVYVGGEFLGGSDILSQMHQSGELRQEIDQAFADAEAAAPAPAAE